MRKLFFASLFLPIAAIAQTKTAPNTKNGTFIPTMGNTNKPVVPVAAPAPEPNPWKLSYYGEYQGPALGNFDLSKTQAPGAKADYTEWYHALKVGYQVAKNVSLSTQFRGGSPTAPGKSFYFKDQRFFLQWSNTIDTPDINIGTKLTVQPPTTSDSRAAGKIITLKIDANLEVKTALRNWSFTCDFQVAPSFYNDPVSNGGKNDLYIGAFPYITVDLVPSWQLLFEGSIDSQHNYNNSFYDYTNQHDDYVDIGPLITIGPHINTNFALRFFTDDISFNAAAVYMNIGVAL